MKTTEHDLIAVGGGTGGLVSAAGAAYLGLRSALVEKHALGGDCLWTGCVPSKAIIADAKRAHTLWTDGLGTPARPPAETSPRQHFGSIMARVHAARATVAHHDDPERFREMGVNVQFGAAHFVSPTTIEVEGVGRLTSKRIVLATGAIPTVPPIHGLEDVGYWTYESVWDETVLPERILILGGGPIGVEFAQTFARLGADVTIVEMAPSILSREDPDVSGLLAELLESEGIRLVTGVAARKVTREGADIVVETADGQTIHTDVIFVATGRRPNTDSLHLGAAGVETHDGAIVVDPYLATTAKGIWGVGDVVGGLQFTHVAEQMAKTVLRNAAVPFKSRFDDSSVPRVTYSDPEVAHVGMSQAKAEEAGGTTFRYEMSDLDRAIADGRTQGFVKISADRKGRILGATIVASGAGELLMPLVLAKQNGLTLSNIANTIFPYPTMVEGVKRSSNEFMRGRLDTPSGRLFKKVVGWLK